MGAITLQKSFQSSDLASHKTTFLVNLRFFAKLASSECFNLEDELREERAKRYDAQSPVVEFIPEDEVAVRNNKIGRDLAD